jgi:transposase
MIDRADAGSAVGRDLLLHADILLAEWKRVRDGGLARAAFQSDTLAWLRPEVATLLAAGAASAAPKTAGVCASLRGIEAGLYTFASVEGVEPTNNAAERALRHAVCWRKTSGGTDGASGSRFVERVLTVVASCRQQNRDVLAVLTEAVLASRTGTTPPSLLPAGA